MDNKKNTLGLIGFIFSIVSIFTAGFTSLIGLILSIIGLNESKKCNNDNKGLSIAGIIISSIMLFIFIIVFGITLLGTASTPSTDNNSVNNASTNNTSRSSIITPKKDKKYGLGDTITFDNLEITFDQNYSFSTIDNSYSDYNGRNVIKIGVQVKNISTETHSLNMFYYKLFGSSGTELNSVTAYFDDTIDYAGDLKPNAFYRTNFYILYDGDGKYSIDFDNYSEKLSVEFNVSK